MFEKVIRDSIHGDITFNEPIFIEIINTPEFQRLRRILQLGATGDAYPSATHTRFSHSIGVYHIVGLFVESKAFIDHISTKDKLLVKLAGLMHDLGHGAFSHTFENITTQSHEQYTKNIISNPKGNIAPILKKYKISPNDICKIIEGTYKNKLINLFVSSQLDADRLDYLVRDSYHCGVDYAALDINWIVRNIRIMDNKIVFENKAINAIESYLLGRYHMYQQVYNHKISTAFDAMFVAWYQRLKKLAEEGHEFFDGRIKDLFAEIIAEEIIPTNKYLMFDDYTMYDIFKTCMKDLDPTFADLSNRLVNRIYFVTRSENEINRHEIMDKLVELGLDPEYYFLEIRPKKMTIYIDGMIDEKDETIWINDKKGIRPLSKLSLFAESMKTINKKNMNKIYLFPKELV